MIDLTREQIKKVCAEEAKYQLIIMRKYLDEKEVIFYLELLRKNSSMIEFDYFNNHYGFGDIDHE